MTLAQRFAAIIAGFSLSIAASGCLDQETTTVVNTDGTCERKIVVASLDSPFPIHVDATWDTSRAVVGTDNDSVKFVLTKKFPTYEALAKEYDGSGDRTHFGVRVSLVRKFRWFFTYYDYNEAYQKFTRDTLVSPDSLLTGDEMSRYTYGDTSKALNAKVEEWHNRNLFQILYRHVRAVAAALPDSAATVAALNKHEEDFYKSLFDNAKTIPQIVGKDGEIISAGLDSLILVAGRVLEIRISPALRTAFGEGVKAAFFHTLSPDSKAGWSFTNIVDLPGTLVQSNSQGVKDGRVTWKLDIDRLSFIDYHMHAEARVMNVWAMLVTGIVLLGLAVAILKGKAPRTNSPRPLS